MRHNQIKIQKFNINLVKKLNMNILTDDIKKLIRRLVKAAIVGTLFQTLYNVVDFFRR